MSSPIHNIFDSQCKLFKDKTNKLELNPIYITLVTPSHTTTSLNFGNKPVEVVEPEHKRNPKG